MKWIQKTPEPIDFRQWKDSEMEDWRPTWDGMPGQVKRNLHASLSNEQGWLCCYCGKRVENNDGHIEHLKPQNQYQDSVLDYSNIVVSCRRNLRPRDPLTCGNAKGNWYDEALFVLPLNQDCENRFAYRGDGAVVPRIREDLPAGETIRRLNLDSSLLREHRSQAIGAAIAGIENLSADEIDIIIRRFKARDDDNRYHPFCFAIGQVLESLKDRGEIRD